MEENEFTPITTQEELDDRINEALKPYADYDDQRARADAAEAKLLRHRIAHEFGLPFDLAERLQGKDEAELRADAKTLSGMIRKRTPASPMASTEPSKGDAKKSAFRSLANSLIGNE